MKINALVLLSTCFIMGCNTNDTTALSTNMPILNLDNYSSVVSDAIVYANDRLSEHESRTKALGTHTSVFSSDALRGHSVVLSASTLLTKPKANTSYYSDPYFADGVLELAADDGSYIKIDSNTGNVKTFMTTVVSGNLNISFESAWSDGYAG